MTIEKFALNATNCYNRLLYFYFFEMPLLQIRYYYGNTEDQFFNNTQAVANLSNHLMVCNDAVRNLDEYIEF
jgi:hypothetical protein